MTPPPHTELVRRVLLGVEVCIVVLATLHSAHATITAGRLQSLQCAVGGGCAEQPPQGEQAVSLVSSGLALAILSGVVLLARVALLQLHHFPRSVGLFYDMLMAVLWILGLAHLVLAGGATTARNLSSGGTLVDTDGGLLVGCWRVRGVAMATAAAVFYSSRLLWELFAIFACKQQPPAEYRAIQQADDARDDDGEKGRGMAVWHAPQAYSPVLAFFPDD